MPKRWDWLRRIKQVEGEYKVLRFGAEHVLVQVRNGALLLPKTETPRDLVTAMDHLEPTYLVRLFAEFETGLRQYWDTTRESNPKTRDLINSLADKHGVPATVLTIAHQVREYRNSLVHEREDTPQEIRMDEARGVLCTFFSFLPNSW